MYISLKLEQISILCLKKQEKLEISQCVTKFKVPNAAIGLIVKNEKEIIAKVSRICKDPKAFKNSPLKISIISICKGNVKVMSKHEQNSAPVLYL